MKYNLPYINNVKAVLLTLVINLGVLFIFNFPGGVNMNGVMADSVICAFVTTIIDMWIVYVSVQKIRDAGRMPQQVPVSRLMQKLPKNPFALGIIYALAFAVITAAINWLILIFFDMHNMTFMTWMVYKLIYATVLSIKIVEYCIFRFVQPDWANSNAVAPVEKEADFKEKPVKNPLPKISLFKEMYGAVTGNLALNLIFGSLLGGAAAQPDGSVVIFPTIVEGIPITGLIFGLIVGILVTNGVVKSLKATILSYGSAMLETSVKDKKFAWMPKRKIPLMCLISFSVMIFSAVALPVIMHLFGKSFFNFYQFTIFVTVYATLISKPLSYVLVQRCLQPDFIIYTLKKNAKE